MFLKIVAFLHSSKYKKKEKKMKEKWEKLAEKKIEKTKEGKKEREKKVRKKRKKKVKVKTFHSQYRVSQKTFLGSIFFLILEIRML